MDGYSDKWITFRIGMLLGVELLLELERISFEERVSWGLDLSEHSKGFEYYYTWLLRTQRIP